MPVAVQPGEELLERGRDSCRNAVVGVVRGRDGRVRDELEAGRVDRDGLREGAADVDADPEPAAHALAASAARRRSGCQRNIQVAPAA